MALVIRQRVDTAKHTIIRSFWLSLLLARHQAHAHAQHSRDQLKTFSHQRHPRLRPFPPQAHAYKSVFPLKSTMGACVRAGWW